MRERHRSCAPAMLAVAALIATLVPSCGGGRAPASSTPVTTLPALTPPVSSGVASATCSLGKGDPNAECTRASGPAKLQHYIETAIDLLVREKPELLDMTVEERPNAGTYRVKDVEGYLDAIVTNIRRQGACAERDPDSQGLQRVLVKDTNDISEGFYLISERGFVQRGPNALAQYCDPASFPVDRVGDVPPAGSGCGKPYPPPIHDFAAKVHIWGPGFVTLDSTPQVGPDVVYCMNAGFTDGRAYCAVRAEHGPEREACENWRVGRAEDSGRYGPTWYFRGQYCTGQPSGCQNHPDNQYGLFAWENGLYVMCGQNGACGEVVVDR
ncbi:MAG: hypothetical protein ACM3PV_09805 [Betaproteobacteria bacterium]